MSASNRRRSLSPPSPEALYHAIPQAPVASSLAEIPEHTSLDIELDGDEGVDELPSPSLVSPLDTRIRWIHFIMGCTVLLPWNGTVLSLENTIVPTYLHEQ